MDRDGVNASQLPLVWHASLAGLTQQSALVHPPG